MLQLSGEKYPTGVKEQMRTMSDNTPESSEMKYIPVETQMIFDISNTSYGLDLLDNVEIVWIELSSIGYSSGKWWKNAAGVRGGIDFDLNDIEIYISDNNTIYERIEVISTKFTTESSSYKKVITIEVEPAYAQYLKVRYIGPTGNPYTFAFDTSARDYRYIKVYNSDYANDKIREMSEAKSSEAAPVITILKDLCLETILIKDQKSHGLIVIPSSGVYSALAKLIQDEIKKLTGVLIPIGSDNSPDSVLPITKNIIALGNRSSSRLISDLYNRHYTLLDLKYPGREGAVVRTLHNPFGNKNNVILIGASDFTGMQKAVSLFNKALKEKNKGKPGELILGRLMEIQLGQGVKNLPNVKNYGQYKIWNESVGYGSSYFGWNDLSKLMAIYYMTGSEPFAREFIRMVKEKPELITSEYHYWFLYSILYWELIEESPLFSDAERIYITQLFAQNFDYKKENGNAYMCLKYLGAGKKTDYIPSRHQQWALVNLFALGRYFDKDYPDPIWKECLRSCKTWYSSLNNYAWLEGEPDSNHWLSTSIEPLITYQLLSGDTNAEIIKNTRDILKNQQIVISGYPAGYHIDPDNQQKASGLDFAALSYLTRVGYILNDGRWQDYTKLTGLDVSSFRLGQSFWNDIPMNESLSCRNTWLLNKPCKAEFNSSGWPKKSIYFENAFKTASFRTSDSILNGDYLLIDGWGRGERLPFHALSVLELWLDRICILEGYYNQVFVYNCGTMPKSQPREAEVIEYHSTDDTAYIKTRLPDTEFSALERSIILRNKTYVLFRDRVIFLTNSDNMVVSTKWETRFPNTVAKNKNAIFVSGKYPETSRGWRCISSLPRDIELEIIPQSDVSSCIIDLPAYKTLLFKATKMGSYLDIDFTLDQSKTDPLIISLLDYSKRGIYKVYLDGIEVISNYDHYTDGSVRKNDIELKSNGLGKGKHRVRIELIGKKHTDEMCTMGFCGLSFISKSKADIIDVLYSITPSYDCNINQISDSIQDVIWSSPVKKFHTNVFFTLIGKTDHITGNGIALFGNLSYYPGKSPVLVVNGDYKKDIKGDLTILEKDHLYGNGLTSIFDFVSSSAPITIDWDLSNGKLNIINSDKIKSTQITIRLKKSDKNFPSITYVKSGIPMLELSPGHHAFTGVFPDFILNNTIDEIVTHLSSNRLETKNISKIGTVDISKNNYAILSPFKIEKTFGSVTHLVHAGAAEKNKIYAAFSNTINFYSPEGMLLSKVSTDSAIKALHFWSEAGLLLAGCQNDKVYAFNNQGETEWIYVSKEPAVVTEIAKKTVWSRDHPAENKGVHALYSGIFLDEKSQAFIGSASAIEIIDNNGKLITNMPQWYGPVTLFALIDDPNGSRNLLAETTPSLKAHLGIINSKTLNPFPRGYVYPPPEQDFVKSMYCNRSHIFYEDFNGDGVKDVMSEINGVWNRITVWNTTEKHTDSGGWWMGRLPDHDLDPDVPRGKPMSGIVFGPGQLTPAKTVLAVDVGKLSGKAGADIVVSLVNGVVLAMTGTCEILWSKTSASPIDFLKTLTTSPKTKSHIITCSRAGLITVYDNLGTVQKIFDTKNTPTAIDALHVGKNHIVIVSYKNGFLYFFQI